MAPATIETGITRATPAQNYQSKATGRSVPVVKTWKIQALIFRHLCIFSTRIRQVGLKSLGSA
jgi:hypothetical protein